MLYWTKIYQFQARVLIDSTTSLEMMIAVAVTTENQVKMRILSAIVHRTLRLLQIFKEDTMMSAAVTAVG